MCFRVWGGFPELDDMVQDTFFRRYISLLFENAQKERKLFFFNVCHYAISSSIIGRYDLLY